MCCSHRKTFERRAMLFVNLTNRYLLPSSQFISLSPSMSASPQSPTTAAAAVTDIPPTADSTEPSVAAPPRFIVGIDVGSTSTRIALLDPARKMPVIVRNTLSNESTPTVVGFPAGAQRTYGEDAMSSIISKPLHAIAEMKAIGLGLVPDANAPTYAGLGPVFVAAAPQGGDVLFTALVPSGTPGEAADDVTLAEAAGFLLKNCLLFCVEAANRSTSSTNITLADLEVVVAYPAHLNVSRDATRRWATALRDGCVIAGATAANVQLVSESVAAALYFHHLLSGSLPKRASTEEAAAAPPPAPVTAAVVTVGANTASVVIISATFERVALLAAESIAVGSRSIDVAIAEMVAAHVAQRTKGRTNIRTHPKSMLKVLREASKAKVMLSSVDRCSLQVESLVDDVDVQLQVQRSDVEAAVGESLVQAVEAMLARALAAAAQASAAANGDVAFGVQRVEVLGGGWRSPVLVAAIQRIFGHPHGQSLDGNMGIAEGSAIYGAVLRGAASRLSPTTPPMAIDAAHLVELVRGGCDADDELSTSRQLADTAALSASLRREAAWHARDELFKQRIRAKNAFEASLFGLDEPMEQSPDMPEADKAAIRLLIQQETQWLDDDCEDASEDAIAARHREFDATVAKYPSIEAYRARIRAEERRKEEELERQAKERQGDKELKTDPQRFKVAQERREQGVALFKQEHWEEAQTRFVQSLATLGQLYDTSSDEAKRRRDEIALSCHLNIASCCLKLGHLKIAVSNCSKALEIDPNNAKALYRRGQASSALNEFAVARIDLEKALDLSKGDAGVQGELTLLQQREAQHAAKEKKMFSKMFA